MKKENKLTIFEIIVYIILGGYFGLFISNILGGLITVLAVAVVVYLVSRKIGSYKGIIIGAFAGFITGEFVGAIFNAVTFG
jgi:hypothetical protein